MSPLGMMSTGQAKYLSVIRADNPILIWPLNENSGSACYDASGNGRHGTYGSAVALGQAPIMPTMRPAPSILPPDISGSSTVQVISNVVDPFAFTGVAPFTFECWINPVKVDNVLPGPRRVFDVHQSDNQNNNGGYAMYWDSTGGLRVDRPSSSGNQEITPQGVYMPAVGVTIHTAMVFDGGTIYLYVNGVQKASYATSGSIPTLNAHLYVANRADLARPGNAYMSNFAVYATALSAAKLTAHYNAG